MAKIHIGGYAAKIGAKPNSIVKRLGEIKKRNSLNIVTTTQAPDAYKPNLGSGDAGQAKVKVKKERKAKSATDQDLHNGKAESKVKVEESAGDDDEASDTGPASGTNAEVHAYPIVYVSKKRGSMDDAEGALAKKSRPNSHDQLQASTTT